MNDPTCMQAVSGGVQCAIDLRDFATGHAILAAVAPESRDELQVHIFTGLLALAEGNDRVAQAAFNQASAHGQETIELEIGKGVLALRDGDRARADAYFARALEVTGHLTQTLYCLVSMGASHGVGPDLHKYASLLAEAATQSIADTPSDPNVYRRRALAYQVLGETELMKRDLTTAAGLSSWW